MTAILSRFYSGTQFSPNVPKNDVKRKKRDGFWIKILEHSSDSHVRFFPQNHGLF